MYNELYAAWQREINEAPLGGLPSDFYARVAEYLKRIKEAGGVQDQKSVKANLLAKEAANAQRMLEELLGARYKKIIKVTTKQRKVPRELLTLEETQMCETFASFAEAYQKFSKNLLQEAAVEPIKVQIKPPPKPEQPTRKLQAVRFVKAIPAIMGADMKSYGPFAAEDVASLPALNAQILVKQGLAVLVEVS
jgi:DNA replication factor GINS